MESARERELRGVESAGKKEKFGGVGGKPSILLKFQFPHETMSLYCALQIFVRVRVLCFANGHGKNLEHLLGYMVFSRALLSIGLAW